MKVREVIPTHDNMVVEPMLQWSQDSNNQEIGFRTTQRVSDALQLAVGGFLNRSRGNWVEGTLAVTPLSWLELGVGLSRGRGYTFEREIVGKTSWFLEEKETSVKGMVGVHLAF